MSSGCLWGSETGNTTKSNSINMKEECLVEEINFNYGKNNVFADGDSNQMPKKLGIKTKKTLGKLLRKIDFLDYDNNDDVLSDITLKLSSLLRNLIKVG
ncbi:hypothetical protein G9A89_016861 [Geosiphon pyriformis]|nr:hypothetical protein G9A89_016861 [Geosiphon pyriformis]